MELKASIHNFINNPFPLWEIDTTTAVVEYKWEELRKTKLIDTNNYSTAGAYYGSTIPADARQLLANIDDNENVYLESYSPSLKDFYNEHGLELYKESESKIVISQTKVEQAFNVLNMIKPVQTCVSKLVRAIQVLKQEDMEMDVSYSHPEIPFSVFVSVCEDDSMISNLRVAESILHEAMHLKLTLIENIIPLIEPGNTAVFFSPWRNEDRPIRGVLHGLFVFRAIHDFFSVLVPHFLQDEKIKNYITYRIEDIKIEIDNLNGFADSADLTEEGAILTRNLMP